jgi:hypothetical protein
VDVPGLFPTFILNLAPRTAATVGKKNGIGNTFGLDDKEPYICKLAQVPDMRLKC